MEPDWNIIIGLLGVAVAVGGIYLKQRSDNAKNFAEVGNRLTAIETRLQIDDATKANGAAAAQTAAELQLLRHCEQVRGACPALQEYQRWASPSQVTSPKKGT